MKAQSLIGVTALFCLSSFAVMATADEYLAETDFFGEAPMVLTVSRMHKPLEDSPASVSVIDRQMIRNSGAREIVDIFRMIPGFVVGYRQGSKPAVTYHGLGSEWHRQMQVLIDGRSVFVPSFGGVPWSNLPLLLDDIERVEVTRGPNAVTYGANAFLATINIITRHAAEDVGSKVSVTHDLDSDSEAQDIYFRVGNQIGDLDWRLTAGREKDDGYKEEFDGKLLEKLNIRTDFLTAYNQFWTIQAGINQSVFERGEGETSNPFREEDSSNSYQNIKWELIEDKVSTTIQLSHTRQDVSDSFQTKRLNEFLDDSLAPLLPAPVYGALSDITAGISFDRDSERTDLEIYQSRPLGSQHTMVYGGSLRKDEIESFFFFNNKEQKIIRANRLFSSLEWRVDDTLILDVGAMLEDTSFTDPELSGRFSIIKKIDQHNLRLVRSSAKRNPFLYEIAGDTRYDLNLPTIPGLPSTITFLTWKTDGNLKPETIQSTEIGLFSEFLDRQVTTDIKVFSYDISDQIIETDVEQINIDPATGTIVVEDYKFPQNQAETSVKGVEASLNFSPRHKKYRLYTGISKLSADSSHSKLEESFPELTAFAGGHINMTPSQQLSFTYYSVDQLSWIDTSRTISGYGKLDMRYQLTLNRKYDTQLELIGYNLADQNSEYLTRNIQEKSLLLRISSRF